MSRRGTGPGVERTTPADVAGRLETIGTRSRLAGVRMDARGSWRWPWPTLEHADIVDCDLEGVSIGRRLLRGATLRDCRFENVRLGDARISGATFTDCTFERSRFVGVGTSWLGGVTFRRVTFIGLDARGARFDRVTFEDCAFDGIRGDATNFTRCSFVRTTFRGSVAGVVLDGCRFDEVDMGEARVSGSFLIDVREPRGFVLPGLPSGFAIDHGAYGTGVEEIAATLSDSDAAALRAEFATWATNPPAELLIDEETFEELSDVGRATVMSALFARRLVRRG